MDLDAKVKLLDELVEKALDLLYEKDMHLILNKALSKCGRDDEHHVGERSIVFRFAHYLQNLMDESGEFEDFNLDCEYNRNGSECKILPSWPNGTYPDVIVHKRGSNDFNLMVIEFKTYWNNKIYSDKLKLREFTDKSGVYKYQKGYVILINKERDKLRKIEV